MESNHIKAAEIWYFDQIVSDTTIDENDSTLLLQTYPNTRHLNIIFFCNI